MGLFCTHSTVDSYIFNLVTLSIEWLQQQKGIYKQLNMLRYSTSAYNSICSAGAVLCRCVIVY